MSSAVIFRCRLETKAPKASFYREYPCELNIQLAGESEPHLRPVFFSYGISKNVDALSGMTSNLVLVDQWAQEFIALATPRPWVSLERFFQTAEVELQKRVVQELGTVVGLGLKDESGRHWIFDIRRASLEWKKEFPIVIGGQAQWLVLQAPPHLSPETLTARTQKTWASLAKFQSEMATHFFPTDQIQVSLRNHRTETELRLR